WRDGSLDATHRELWEAPQVVEELFDLRNDPWEMKNLAGDPAFESHLSSWRERLKSKMLATRDTGVVPEAMFRALVGEKGTAADFVASKGFDYEAVVEAAFRSGEPASMAAESWRSDSPDSPVVRYWGLQGMRRLASGERGEAESWVVECLNDAYSANRVVAAEILWGWGMRELAKQALVAELDRAEGEFERLRLLNGFKALDLVAAIPTEWVERERGPEGTGGYVVRALDRILPSE
ncbi:MAG: hypothetical protein ACQKBU_01645, partial [Verrucomicrobiales bacterium]